MSKIFRYLRLFFSLLFQGHFFLIVQRLLTALLPDRILGMKKAVLYRLDRERRPAPRGAEGFDVFPGNEGDIEEIVADLYDGSPMAREFYDDFHRQGVRPWVARRDGRIVGVLWLYRGRYLLPWEGYDAWLLDLEIEPTALFFANEFVSPEARRQGILTILAERVFEADPDCECYTCVDETNFPSKLLHEKLGFRRCAVVYFIRLFQTTRCLYVPKQGRRRWLKPARGTPVALSLIPETSASPR